MRDRATARILVSVSASVSRYVPSAAILVLAAALAVPMGLAFAMICAAALVAAALAGVHHADVVASRIREPLGTLVLSVAITTIEVALLGFHALPGSTALPRDMVLSVLMIACNGVIGLCLLAGRTRAGKEKVGTQRQSSAFAGLVALIGLSCVLPPYFATPSAPVYAESQLAFAAFASLALWVMFLVPENVHPGDSGLPAAGDEHVSAALPARNRSWTHLMLALVSVVAVVGLSIALAPMIEQTGIASGTFSTAAGFAVALLILAPTAKVALAVARAGNVEASLYLALRSAMAGIGLAIPVFAAASLVLDIPLRLGLEPLEIVFLALTFLLTAITLWSKRTAVQGAIHLIVLAAFLFFAVRH